MVYLDIHDIVDIKSNIVKLKGSDCYVKRIEITTIKGSEFINLFSDKFKNLMINN